MGLATIHPVGMASGTLPISRSHVRENLQQSAAASAFIQMFEEFQPL
jgi:hypothetical protein